MGSNKIRKVNVLKKAINQMTPILIMIGALVLNFLIVEQKKPAFIVNDPSLSYPVVEETLTTAAAAGIMFLYPFVALVIHTLVIAKGNYNRNLLVYWWDRTWCAMFICFVFIILSEFLKRFVGHLRPNFFAMCGPVYDESTAVIVGNNQKLIVEYECANDTTYESAKSFPSGHSLFAVLLFAAIGNLFQTTACLVSDKIVLDPTWGVRVMTQAFLTVIIGPSIALTRFTERYHHAFDVTVGVILGYIAFTLLVLLERIIVKNPHQLDLSSAQNQIVKLQEAPGKKTRLVDTV